MINYPINSFTKKQTNNVRIRLKYIHEKTRTLKVYERLTFQWFIPELVIIFQIKHKHKTKGNLEKKNTPWFLLKVMFNRFVINFMKLRINNQALLT